MNLVEYLENKYKEKIEYFKYKVKKYNKIINNIN